MDGSFEDTRYDLTFQYTILGVFEKVIAYNMGMGTVTNWGLDNTLALVSNAVNTNGTGYSP